MNTLEDAFINIGMDEQKFLNTDSNKAVSRAIKKYINSYYLNRIKKSLQILTV